MNATTPQLIHAPPQSSTLRPGGSQRPGSASPDHQTWGETLIETAPLVGAPAFFGPPVSYVLGPWLFLVLLLIGPFALIVTLVLVLAVAAVLLTVLAAVLASPFLLIRHLHAHNVVRAKARAPVAILRNHRVISGELGSPQPKGVS